MHGCQISVQCVAASSNATDLACVSARQIVRHFRDFDTCPSTLLRLSDKRFVKNHQLRKAIQEYKETLGDIMHLQTSLRSTLIALLHSSVRFRAMGAWQDAFDVCNEALAAADVALKSGTLERGARDAVYRTCRSTLHKYFDHQRGRLEGQQVALERHIKVIPVAPFSRPVVKGPRAVFNPSSSAECAEMIYLAHLEEAERREEEQYSPVLLSLTSSSQSIQRYDAELYPTCNAPQVTPWSTLEETIGQTTVQQQTRPSERDLFRTQIDTTLAVPSVDALINFADFCRQELHFERSLHYTNQALIILAEHMRQEDASRGKAHLGTGSHIGPSRDDMIFLHPSGDDDDENECKGLTANECLETQATEGCKLLLARVLRSGARSLLALGQAPRALLPLQVSYQVLEGVAGAEYQDGVEEKAAQLAATQIDLAETQIELGQHAEAEALLMRTAASQTAALGGMQNLQVARTLELMGTAMRRQARFLESLDASNRSFQIRVIHFGMGAGSPDLENREIADSFDEIGITLRCD